MEWTRTPCILQSGHGVASGTGADQRFPEGTLHLQAPYFLEVGMDLGRFHPGTLNLSLAPARYETLQSTLTVPNVRWFDGFPPEDFSFFDCRLVVGEETHQGLIYHPHPETKPDHFHDPHTLEILAPFIENLTPGTPIVLETDPQQIRILGE